MGDTYTLIDTKFFEEHKVFGNIIFPMTGYVEMALESAKTLLQEGIQNYFILFPLVLFSARSS
jgi:hypothetical protein